MNKIFSLTALASVVFTSTMPLTANASIDLAGESVQLYGQAAGYYLYNDPKIGASNMSVNIESRIGFRGRVNFEDLYPTLIWQIEGGNADNGPKSGQLGARDTYIGFDFTNLGSVKFGRQLVASYNYVDWPHSNPGLGNVFDWHNTIGGAPSSLDANGVAQYGTAVAFADRADNVIRFDSATWKGFNFQASASGMAQTNNGAVASVGASYTQKYFNLHAGYYYQNHSTGNYTHFGANYAIYGGSIYLGDFTFTGAYKMMENTRTNNTQNALSVTGQYVLGGKWVLKAGYAETQKSSLALVDDSSKAMTGRIGYLLPSAYMYVDMRKYDMLGSDKSHDGLNVLLGTEYYF